MRKQGFIQGVDWLTVLLYLTLVLIGWVNIYAADYHPDHPSIFDTERNYGKQFIWIISALVIAGIIMIIDSKFYTTFSTIIYGTLIILLVAVLIFGKEVAGSKSWFVIGSFQIQPSEFAKFATNLALAKFLSTLNVSLKQLKTQLIAFAIFLVPALLIVLQGDTGSALVFVAFVLVLFREGYSAQVLIYGFLFLVLSVSALLINKFMLLAAIFMIALLAFLNFRKNRSASYFISIAFIVAGSYVFLVDYGFNHILKPHQQERINVLFGKELDLHGAAYNVNQSKIAIGSGGFYGKGFLNGTQTKFDFVPEQSTDFIFCTIGEEHGFLGSFVVIALFVALLLRIIFIAERQRSDFTRIYAYGVALILFFHLTINIGMTIGLAPIIGIPFPFISYGGSSLWSFTILLFILVKLDADRLAVLR